MLQHRYQRGYVGRISIHVHLLGSFHRLLKFFWSEINTVKNMLFKTIKAPGPVHLNKDSDQTGYFVCLFELMLYVPVNNNDHVGTLPPYFGTFTQHYNVMTLKMCFINITTQANQYVYIYGWFD